MTKIKVFNGKEQNQKTIHIYEKDALFLNRKQLLDKNFNKYSRGVVALIAGSKKFTGAALLSSGAAIYGGAGAVFYYGTAFKEVVTKYPSIITAPEFPETIRANSILIGSGLNFTYSLSDILKACDLADTLIIDADALSEIAKKPELIKDLPADKTILIPNIYEISRLLNIVDHTKIAENPLFYVKLLHKKLKLPILMRDIKNILIVKDKVYMLDEEFFKHSHSLAMSGSGDVFSGILASLLALKNDISFVKKILISVFLHRMSCELAVAKYQSPIINAEDLIKQLPYSWKYILKDD